MKAPKKPGIHDGIRFFMPALFISFLLFSPSLVALDPGFYSVPLKKFHPIVYHEKTSLFSVFVRGEVFKPLTTPFQRVISRKRVRGGTRVTIEAGDTPVPVPLRNKKRYLRDTRFLNLGTASVQAMAKKFYNRKNEIRFIEKHVHDFIQGKTTGIPLLPARNIIASRSGDCTEHTILSVALLRANNIPARAVVGMILVPYFRGKKNVFVYHMWAEAWQGGRWRLVDATRPGKKEENRYIALAYHSLASEMPLSYFRAISAIEKIAVTYAGETKLRR